MLPVLQQPEQDHCDLKYLEGTTYQLDFTIPAQEIVGRVSERVAVMSRDYPLPGFRSHAAKRVAVERLIGRQLRQEVIEELLGENFVHKLSGMTLDVMGSPRFDWLQDADSGQGDIHLRAQFDAYPEVNLDAYRSLVVEVPRVELGYQEYKQELDLLRSKYGRWMVVDKHSAGKQKIFVDLAFCRGDVILHRMRKIEITSINREFHVSDSKLQCLINVLDPYLQGKAVGARIGADIDQKTADKLALVHRNATSIKIFVNKIIEYCPESDDRALLVQAGCGLCPGVDPWTEFTQSVDRALVTKCATVFLKGLLRAVINLQPVEISDRIIDDLNDVEVERSAKTLRRMKDDLVAVEISRLLMRGETQDRMVLDIVSHNMRKAAQQNNGHLPNEDGPIKDLLAWIGANCTFVKKRLTKVEIDELYDHCSLSVRGSAIGCLAEISMLLMRDDG